jgi:hypothetical protein
MPCIEKALEQEEEEEEKMPKLASTEVEPPKPIGHRKGSGGNRNDFRINQKVGGNGGMISIHNYN